MSMIKLISDNFTAKHCIFVHDLSMTRLLEYYYYEETLKNEQVIGLQHFGKSTNFKNRSYSQKQDTFKFDMKMFCDFVNKLEVFSKTEDYPKNTYIAKSARSSSPAIQVQKVSEMEYLITRSNNIYDAFEQVYNWSFSLSNSQLDRLLEHLIMIKASILEKSATNLKSLRETLYVNMNVKSTI